MDMVSLLPGNEVAYLCQVLYLFTCNFQIKQHMMKCNVKAF